MFILSTLLGFGICQVIGELIVSPDRIEVYSTKIEELTPIAKDCYISLNYNGDNSDSYHYGIFGENGINLKTITDNNHVYINYSNDKVPTLTVKKY